MKWWNFCLSIQNFIPSMTLLFVWWLISLSFFILLLVVRCCLLLFRFHVFFSKMNWIGNIEKKDSFFSLKKNDEKYFSNKKKVKKVKFIWKQPKNCNKRAKQAKFFTIVQVEWNRWKSKLGKFFIIKFDNSIIKCFKIFDCMSNEIN
mgnify:CR=1 FL=1